VPFRRPKRRCENNIKMDFREIRDQGSTGPGKGQVAGCLISSLCKYANTVQVAKPRHSSITTFFSQSVEKSLRTGNSGN
jgi:hypothetical protein